MSSVDATAKWLHPQTPALRPGSVYVWSVALAVPDHVRESLRELLSPDELQRAARFRFERDAHRFMVARGSARCLLAGYAGAEPRNLKFSYSQNGKPAIAEPAGALRFNLSHSQDLALIALTHGREVGVDLEWMRPDVETGKLAERYFSERECESLRAMAESHRVAAFYRCWTCKEAFLKAQGTGLSRNLGSFDVELAPNLPARLTGTRPDPSEADRWSLQTLDVATGYAASVAAAGSIHEVVQLPLQTQS